MVQLLLIQITRIFNFSSHLPVHADVHTADVHTAGVYTADVFVHTLLFLS